VCCKNSGREHEMPEELKGKVGKKNCCYEMGKVPGHPDYSFWCCMPLSAAVPGHGDVIAGWCVKADATGDKSNCALHKRLLKMGITFEGKAEDFNFIRCRVFI